jgi:hypothetical protein
VFSVLLGIKKLPAHASWNLRIERAIAHFICVASAAADLKL